MTPEEAAHIGSQPAWWTKRRTLQDVINCRLGRHQTVLLGTDDGELIERCSCGAIRFGGRSWLRDRTCDLGRREGWS